MSLPVVIVDGKLIPDYAYFRETFSQFESAAEFPDSAIDSYWILASGYIELEISRVIKTDIQWLLINYATAHLMSYNLMIESGTNPDSGAAGMPQVVISSATDNVSYSTLPPPSNDSYYKWFFSATPYGRQYLASLSAQATGGRYVGGSFGLPAMRGGRSNW